jgi:pimeloyl-ACP methyl ester carboxylesterase
LAHFILVHGSFHGPWCWARIAPLLQAAGHTVSIPDFADAKGAPYPGLPEYAALVAASVWAAERPAILVGHSMGGLVISQAAEQIAPHLSALAYVTGLMLRDGETLNSFLAAHADLGVEDLVLQNMIVSEGGALATFPAEAAPAIFYNACTVEDAAWASSRLRPQPTAVYAAPLALSAQNFGALPRYYIECTQDRAVSLPYQRQMCANQPCEKIYMLDADHSPFLSNIAGLTAALLDIAANTQ